MSTATGTIKRMTDKGFGFIAHPKAPNTSFTSLLARASRSTPCAKAIA
jgi:hypothetical protein